MIIKAFTIHTSGDAIHNMASKNLPFSAARAIARAATKLKEEADIIEKERLKLVNMFSDGGSSVTSGNMPAFIAKFSAMMEADVEVDIEPITIPEDAMDSMTVSANDVAALRWLIANFA